MSRGELIMGSQIVFGQQAAGEQVAAAGPVQSSSMADIGGADPINGRPAGRWANNGQPSRVANETQSKSPSGLIVAGG